MKNQKITLWNKSFLFLILISLFSSMGFNMVYVMISNYAISLKDSLTIAGMISGIFSISALLVRPIAGRSADYFSKRNLCILANLFMGLAVLGYGFTDQISVLFLLRILHGFAFGLSSTATIALVTEFIPKERMGEGIGCYGIGQVISQVIGPNLGVDIANDFGFQPLFLLTSALAILSGLLLLLFPYPKTIKIRGSSKPKLTLQSLIAKEVVVYTIVGGMFSFSNGVISSFLILLGKERQIANAGIFFSVGAIVIFVVRLLISRMIDKHSLTLIVNLSLLLTASSMVMIGAAPALGWLVLASVLKSLGQGTGQISLQTECIKRVDPTRVGVAMSTFYIGADIGQGLGPILGGALSDRFNYMVMYFTCGALMVLTMLFFHLYQRNQRKKAKE